MMLRSTKQCIQHLFEKRVEQEPDAIALVFQDQQISYRELNNRANQLANHLQSCGVKPEVLVGICLERSIEMVIGLLGILKAGGAYVPLDPSYPKKRLDLMLADAQVPVLITQSHIAEKIDCQPSLVICLDKEWSKIESQSVNLGSFEVNPNNLAYIIYTSGSTGKPKGVMLTHENLLHYVTALQSELQIRTDDLYLYIASISFSSSRRQLILPLTQGATVLIASEIERKDPFILADIVKDRGVTVMDAVPSFWRSYTDALLSLETQLRHDLLDNKLRLILSASEPLRSNIPKTWMCEFNHPAQHFHMFGQTETSGIVSIYHIAKEFIENEDKIRTIPVGRAIANTQIYILNSQGQPAIVGEQGEIYIAGAGVGRGYLNQPELTATKFSEDSLGKRVYKTGDWGTYLPDGNINYLSRQDYLIKIRGFRIELGEIESMLATHPSVSNCVVTVYEDKVGSKSLAAYVVSSQEIATGELRSFLQNRLPDYMIPAIFVLLDRLPLNPNGKIDRFSLPPIDSSNLEIDNEFIPPSSLTEKLLANIWVEVLGVKKVGVYDNFFDLGGHSLLAIQVISRCRQVFSVEVSFQQLFESPTIATLSLIIREQKLQELDISTYQAITPRNKSTNIALSLAQQRLWILDQLEPNSALYNMQDAVRLIGELQVQILQQALDAIAKHHEIIRTSYITENGNPIQLINAPKSIELITIDLQSYEETEREIQAQKILQQESQRPFNLASDTMLRGCLLQLAPQQHILLLVIHHIASDAWSMEILWEELTQLYQSFLAGHDNPLPELPIQYADFTVWQSEWLSGEVLDKQLNYWKQQLANADPVLELPTDFPRPLVQSYRGSSKSIPIPQKLSSSLQALCRREGVTLYMLLLAVFQTLLYRYTGSEDILVGSPIAGRNRTEVERLIGFFVNTLVLRTDLSGNPSFEQLLAKVRSTTLEAYSYQDLPFNKLVEELQPERSLSYNPIFQIMFSVEKSPISQREFAGLTANSFSIESKTAKFDLDVTVFEEGISELIVQWNYNTDLFNLSAIERMAGHFQALLKGIVIDSKQAISQLPLLTKFEQEQLLIGWNNRATDYSQDKCIQQLFEEQVENTPDAIAVIFQKQQLTYRELNNRANQLAHYLRSQSVAAEQFIGISVERSLEMIVAILGVLKAGAAYIPLDPVYPSDRLSYMIADANISVILTQNKLRSQLSAHQAEFICLDSDWENIAPYSQENPIKTNTDKNLAYVIYTSGSTGKPKGVMISHQSLSRFTQTAICEYQITADDRVLQFASINFDATVEEIYPSLCTGATLVLRTDEMLSNLQTFFQACEDLQLTVLDLPTAYWHQLAAELGTTNTSLPESLRLVIIGGEKVQIEPVRAWQKYVAESGKCDRLQLINTYGPTETTVVATVYRIPVFSNNSEIPIGRPLAHLQTYILDPHLQPVPIGVTGELHIGGDSLAIGYLNRPELTDEKFIANPFNSQVGSRLYKTGDLARYRADGNIEYLGRIDNQVKIRGFRIELGEIETILAQHPNIRTTVITAREDISNDKRLVAYIVAEQVQPKITDIRAFLQERLPNYMMPSAFVFLEAIPITPNGKIDYRSLPIPDISSIQLETEFVSPSNPTQEMLAKIWSNILGIERVGINDNFFELGGHSLLSVRLVSEIEKTFNYRIPLSSLFKISTIAEIAKLIDERKQETTSVEESSLGLNLDDYRALLSHSAGKTGLRLGKRGLIINILPDFQTTSKPFVWIGEGRTSKKLKLARPVYVMPGASLAVSMNSHDDYILAIATLLVDELLSAQPSGSYSLGGWCYNGLVALEMAQQLRKMGKQVDLVSLIDKSGKSKIFRFVHRINSAVGTLRFHLYNFSKLSIIGKWQYIRARLHFSRDDSPELKIEPNKSRFEFDQEAFDVLGKATKDYIPKHYAGRILLVFGSEQIVHGQKDVKHFDLSWLFPYSGWGNVFRGKVHLAKIECDHLELMEQPYCQEVGQAIQRIEDSL